MTAQTLLLFLAGGALLIIGAELLVRGAARLAAAAGISPLVVGLTVVAFGTSSPELAITVEATYAGQADLAVGNVVGSNIANVLLILGLSALISPLVVSQQLVRLDVPLMIGASVLTWVLALDGHISRGNGLVLFAGILGYTGFLVWQSRRASAGRRRAAAAAEATAVEAGEAEHTRGAARFVPNIALIVIGLALLVVGSKWLVDSASAIAAALGVSELVIGLTIVALGTSLPEAATSVVASIRGERDIAVGNIVGSNLFNLLTVLGLGSIVAPAGIPVAPGALTFDIPIMTAVAVACLPIFLTGYSIARWEGFVFLGYYVAYVAYLILAAAQHDLLPAFSAAMLGFAIPLTVLTLGVLLVRAMRKKARTSPGP